MENKEVTKVYDSNDVEIGERDSEGVTRYYNTPEARAFFTSKTGYKFEE